MYDFSKYQYTPPLLSCPMSKFNNKEDEFGYVQFGQFPTVFFSSHISPLEWFNNKNGKFDNFSCRFCGKSSFTTSFYSCKECVCQYHKECVEPISNHPYHPKHYLRLCYFTALDKEVQKCLLCSHDMCWFYSCSLCDFIMCESCARKPPLLAIANLKRHEHTLFYFSRKGSLFCDICSLNDHKSAMYYCSQCEFFVHKDCIYLPCIIRISRHEHRLSFSSLLTPGKCLCGVCREKINTNYGRYSCVKGCTFSVHSKCATRKDVWDGKELEGEPEDVFEDITSFIEISDGVIQHFSHQCHHMRLDKETNIEFDKEKRCRACTLPVYDDIIYKCVQYCDFILHQKCAHLPRKKQHPLHPHPLSLQVHSAEGFFFCSACERISNGFKYKCFEKGCKFRLDICCSYVSEPFNYWYHPHSLFLTHKPKSLQNCSICKTDIYENTCLTCGECGFELCFRCATLPKKLRYKHDDHFLIHWYDEDASDQYCCDVCETKADPKKYQIYMCDECNIMVHITCLLGDMDMYMMPGRTISYYGSQNISILSNNRLTRNICRYCHDRCQGYIIYKESNGDIFCSFYCMV